MSFQSPDRAWWFCTMSKHQMQLPWRNKHLAKYFWRISHCLCVWEGCIPSCTAHVMATLPEPVPLDAFLILLSSSFTHSVPVVFQHGCCLSCIARCSCGATKCPKNWLEPMVKEHWHEFTCGCTPGGQSLLVAAGIPWHRLLAAGLFLWPEIWVNVSTRSHMQSSGISSKKPDPRDLNYR